MQEADAERRIKILRGERPPTPPPPPPSSADSFARSERNLNDDAGRYRKRRRLAGEDDTERDIRFAREDAEQALSKRDELSRSSQRESKGQDVPLLDSSGHINLFPEGSKKAENNAEAEAEKKKKERSYEDQYTMRFSNAEGFKEQAGRQPWYSSGAQVVTAPDAMPDKNVWGKEDPMRREREKTRMDVNDPLAAMKRGVRQLKATQQERKQWAEQKRKETESLKTADNHDATRHRRRREQSMNSLDNFKLDESASRLDGEKHYRGSHHPRRHDHRDRSRNRSRDHPYKRSHETSSRSRRHRHDRHDEERRNRRDSHKSESGKTPARR